MSDYSWLAEIEKDLALVMVRLKSKFDRLVFTQQLVEQARPWWREHREMKTDLDGAKGVRNGLMIALLALCPIRPKQFRVLGNWADIELVLRW